MQIKTKAGFKVTIYSLVIISSAAMLSILGCGKTSQVYSLKELKGRNEKVSNITDLKTGDATPIKTVERTVEGGADFQAKSVAVLRSTIEACLGTNVTKITDSMIIPAGQAPGNQDGEGHVKFLGSGRYNVGEDILDKEAKNLEGSVKGTRLGTLADTLTASYLMSLGLVADVVAHNCDPAKNLLCACGNIDEATKLMARCLTTLDPTAEDFKDAAQAMSKKCSADKYSYRQAIASLVGSISFAKAR